MFAILALGFDRPVDPGAGGWNWWAPLGAIVVFLLATTAHRRPPLALAIGLAALGGLIAADLTEAFGVVPVWGLLLMYTLARTLKRTGRRSQV